MIKDRLFRALSRRCRLWPAQWPGVETGQFGFVEGPAMASVDKAKVQIIGRGGHGASPHETVDPVLASASFITALQSIVSRNVDPREMAVLTVGSIHGGTASNVIPESVELQITARLFSPRRARQLEERLPALARAQAESFGARLMSHTPVVSAVINHAQETVFAREVARRHFPSAQIAGNVPAADSERGFRLHAAGAAGFLLFVGNGESAPLHSPHYDFNDTVIAPAARFWVRLAKPYLS